jgi:hypothetical protein
MLGGMETRQKVEITPESIRKVEMKAQADMETILMLSYFRVKHTSSIICWAYFRLKTGIFSG